MDMRGVMLELGGVASRAQLVSAANRAEVDRALRAGAIVADARGRYALPEADVAVRLAHQLHGVLSRESAALHHGWPVKHVPERPHVSVPRNCKVGAEVARTVHLHRDDLHPEDVDGIATSRAFTLRQCIRTLPFDAALVVADSALRSGFPRNDLRRIAISSRGPGSRQAKRIAQAAREEAANPFESVLRSICLTVPGLNVEPQVTIRGRARARPDLVDEELRLVLEADSFEWHGSRSALRRDARRYNLLIVDGWLVLRFAWEDVMFEPEYVREVLVAAVVLITRQAA